MVEISLKETSLTVGQGGLRNHQIIKGDKCM
jgi:hypothetical protein